MQQNYRYLFVVEDNLPGTEHSFPGTCSAAPEQFYSGIYARDHMKPFTLS